MYLYDVEQSRDPLYLRPKGGFDDEEGEYMRPWFTPLSGTKQRWPGMICDAREHVIWITDKTTGCSTDPVLCPGYFGEEVVKEVVEEEGFDVVEELTDLERRHAAQNCYNLEAVRSRDASEVLRDVNRWYRELKETPGQLRPWGNYTPGWEEPETIRALCLNHGWPDNFDGEAFEIALIRTYAARQAKSHAEEPLKAVEFYENQIRCLEERAVEQLKTIDEATSAHEEWKARVYLFKAQHDLKASKEGLQRAKETAARYCPDGQCQKQEDLPLWEWEQLRLVTDLYKNRVQHPASKELDYRDRDATPRVLEIQHQHNVRKLALHNKAFAASQADADRLCPGRTFEEASGGRYFGAPDTLAKIEKAKARLADDEEYCKGIHDLKQQIPAEVFQKSVWFGAQCARPDLHVAQSKRNLEYLEKPLAENGNTY